MRSNEQVKCNKNLRMSSSRTQCRSIVGAYNFSLRIVNQRMAVHRYIVWQVDVVWCRPAASVKMYRGSPNNSLCGSGNVNELHNFHWNCTKSLSLTRAYDAHTHTHTLPIEWALPNSFIYFIRNMKQTQFLGWDVGAHIMKIMRRMHTNIVIIEIRIEHKNEEEENGEDEEEKEETHTQSLDRWNNNGKTRGMRCAFAFVYTNHAHWTVNKFCLSISSISSFPFRIVIANITSLSSSLRWTLSITIFFLFSSPHNTAHSLTLNR